MYKRRRTVATADTEENAKKTAVTLLAYRENTKTELTKKLIDRGYSKENAEIAVQFVVEKNYLNENRYFLRMAEYYACTKHYGKRRIMQEARKKGFSEETLSTFEREAFEEIDFNVECFKALRHVKAGCYKKVETSLFKRGFTGTNIRYALERYRNENGVDFYKEDDDLTDSAEDDSAENGADDMDDMD